MNRVIKFKIWDTVEKKFLSLKDYQDLGAIEVENDGTLTLSPRFRFLTSMMIMPERFIPCQYIGLKDKNGKEIYEGDVLNNTAVNFKFIVKFENTKYILQKLEYPDDALDMNDYFHRIPTMFEVIGNIYESEVKNE